MINTLVVILGILNIIAGGALAFILIMMQGITIFLVGLVYIFYGVSLLCRNLFNKVLFFGIIPVTALFSMTMIMAGTSTGIPEYARIPMGLVNKILIPFWLLIFANVYFFTRPKVKEYFTMDKRGRFSLL